ncbi:MAG: septation protein IspZ [Alphaproteobacteria bacterium]|nr:septation protein IspZ [Alphaproteobacteria bacterium]MBV9692362.1 septation protein IspZ [Alphaproteobacteria bacterium]
MTPAQVARPILLDLLAAIAFAAVFFVGKYLLKLSGLHSVYAAAAAGMSIGLAQLLAKKWSREPIGPLQWLSLGVVVALGTMTIALHNEHFIKLKPTVIDLAVGLFMATRDWMTPYLPQDVRAVIPRRTIMLAEKLWAAVMIFFAAANVAVAFVADFSLWALYATFVPTTIIVGLFFVQYAAFRSLADRNRKAAGAGEPA